MVRSSQRRSGVVYGNSKGDLEPRISNRKTCVDCSSIICYTIPIARRWQDNGLKIQIGGICKFLPKGLYTFFNQCSLI